MSIAKTLELTTFMEGISHSLKVGLNLENVVSIYEKATRYDQRQLKEACEHFIDKNAEILDAQKSLTKLPSQCLQEIIRRDSLSLNESKIFELVVEWHVYHNRTEDLSIELVREIRFELIPSEELFELLSRYKLIINERLVT